MYFSCNARALIHTTARTCMMTNKMTMRKDLQTKIDRSIQILKKMEPIALKYRKEGFIGAFSGGKDSQVIRQLLNMAEVEHTMKYQWTTIDPPEVYHFVVEQYPDVVIERPKESFWRLCYRHGILPTQFKRFCCRELKESRDFNCVTVTGVRAAESARRKHRQEVEIQTRRRHPDYVRGTLDEFSMYKETHVDCIQGKDKLIVNPIIDWSEEDVWDFLGYMDLPSCELYDRGYSRVGCLFCPMASRRSLHMMERDYPKYKEAFIRLIGRIREKRRSNGGYDIYQTLTDAQVFDAWLNKYSYKKALCQSCQLTLDLHF